MSTQTTKTNHYFRALAVLAAMAMAASLLTMLGRPAEAAFPGLNGKIAFTRFGEGGIKYDVWVMNPDGSNKKNLTSNGVGGSSRNPSFSPDGKKIAYQRMQDGNEEIYVMKLTGSDKTRLTNSPAHDQMPSFSPDGQKIAFLRNAGGVGDVYVMNANGSGKTKVAGNASLASSPVFSPDGSKITFARDLGLGNGSLEIFVMNPNGTGQTNVSDHAGSDEMPSFSPDGQKIAFMSTRDANQLQIYVMNAYGSNQANISNSGQSDYGPNWGPRVTVRPPFPFPVY